MSDTMKADFAVTSHKDTHPGLKKDSNEDFIAVFEPDGLDRVLGQGRLYIIADGVGGGILGEKASSQAAERVRFGFFKDTETPIDKRLRQIVAQAGNEIFNFIEESGHDAQMATTMVAVALYRGQMTIANVGDSRAYRIRDGVVDRLTVDHTVAGQLYYERRISEEEERDYKGKNRLTRSLGGEPDPEVDIFQEELQTGDRLLLCSDGLCRYTLKSDIARLAAGGSPTDVVKRSIDFAIEQGGADNISVVVVDIGERTANPQAFVITEAPPTQRVQMPPPLPPLPETPTQPPREEMQTVAHQPTVSSNVSRKWVGAGVVIGGLAIVAAAVVGLFLFLNSGSRSPDSGQAATQTAVALIALATQPSVEIVAATQTEEPPPTDQPGAGPTAAELCGATISKAVNVHTGPGKIYTLILPAILENTHVSITGKSDDLAIGRWVQIIYPDGPDGEAWIYAGKSPDGVLYDNLKLDKVCDLKDGIISPSAMLINQPTPKPTENVAPATDTVTPEPTVAPTDAPTEPPTETQPPPPADYKCVYTVQAGDTLFDIAGKLHVDWDKAQFERVVKTGATCQFTPMDKAHPPLIYQDDRIIVSPIQGDGCIGFSYVRWIICNQTQC